MDGRADFGQFSNAELYAALRGIDRGSRPIDYANLLVELQARGLDAPDVASGSGEVETLPVRFNGRRSISESGNSFGLIGEGTLAIGKDSLCVSARRRGLLGFGRSKEELHFPLETVANVVSEGVQVRFELRPAGKAPRHVLLRAESEDAARRIRARLPARQTDDFRAAIADSNEFLKRLDALGTEAYASRAIIAANVVVFLAMIWAGAGILVPDPQVHLRWGSNYAPLTANGEWWRLVSSMFLHFGLIHLALNMWCLYAFGILTERLYGSARFVCIYLCAGATGSLLSLAWNPGANSAGASGAVFGVLGALIAFVLDKRNGVPRSIVMAQRGSLLAFAGYNLVFGAIHPAIDNAAHIGGLIAGAVLGKCLARPLDPEGRAQSGRLRPVVIVAAWLMLALIAYRAISTAADGG